MKHQSLSKLFALIGVAVIPATIEIPTTEGGVLLGSFSVSLEGNQCPLGPPSWTTTFSMPDRGNFSDGTNESNFMAEDWEGN